MKMHEKSVLKLNELPLRAEKLTEEKISEIFGGCRSNFSECRKNSDCCSHECVPFSKVQKTSNYCL